MAASPAEITLRNLSGKYALNKTLADNPDAALTLQGIGWLTRKAIGIASVTLVLKQYEGPVPEKKDDAAAPKVTHIDIDQTASGLTTTTELRTLDNTARPHEDKIFGSVKGRTRFVPLGKTGDAEGGKGDDKDLAYLREGWIDSSDDLEVVENFIESLSNGWTAWGVWGFQEIEGKRMYARRICVRKGDECVRLRLVYDYNGAL